MSSTPATGGADIVQVIRFVLRNYALIFGLSIALGVAVYVGSAFITPIYRSEVLVVPAEEATGSSMSAMLSNIGSIGRLAGLKGTGPTRKDEALAMLKSRAFVSRFMEASNAYAVLYPEAWDDETGDWKAGRQPPSEQDRYLRFVESVLKVSENKQTGIVRIGIELDDRLAASRWANEIVRLLNERFREYVAAEAQRSIEYLYSELEKASSMELRQVIHRLIETQVQTIMLTNVRKDFVFRIIDPAVAPDADYYVAPRRALLTFFGLVVGGLVGLGIALFREALLASRRAEAAS